MLKIEEQAQTQLPIIAKLKESLDENDIDSLLEIGARYWSFKDVGNAEYYFTKAANLGSREAMTFLSKLPIRQQDALSWLKQAADLGDPDAMIAVARHSTQTNLPQLQFDQAKHYYFALLARGESEILEEFLIFLVKIGDIPSLLILEKYIGKVTAKKQHELVFLMLRMRRSSLEVVELCLQILEKLSNPVDQDICFELARAFNGLGLKKEADPWMKAAADLGHPLADVRLKGWPK